MSRLPPKLKGNRIETNGETSIIFTSRGHEILVDTEDLEILRQYTWHTNLIRKCQNGNVLRYPRTTVNGKHINIAYLLIDVPEGLEVDHINRDTLDNRKSNLRAVTRLVNARNKDPYGKTPYQPKKGKKYKGVSYRKPRWFNARPWCVHIYMNGRSRYVGCYYTEEVAALAYNEAALAVFGDRAVLNKVKGHPK